ncbi:MarR family transcriptional regulator [Sulfuricella sp. T08]|uniref:MarR family winged helix-turn-helix transcriptional regulator n=1 Tax=Sulfuricella sp. T08 TaxID=1632857 RepID=UPI000617977E|nr:MarR family transcriptional regulator [Sulfuricella sp. T08]GAO35987.1 MarR family transcriptional regulator [Sulfuricella sp. T08]
METTQESGLRGKSLEALKKFRQIISSAQQHFRRIEDQCGLSGAQLWVLREVAGNPGQRVSDLAKAMSVHMSTASNLLDKLSKRNLIRRERNDPDQRIVRLFLTEEGMRIIASAPQPARGVLPDALNRLPDEALDNLNRSLTLLLDAIEVRDEKATMKPLSDLIPSDLPSELSANEVDK